MSDQFNQSLQKLAEWGKYLDGQEGDLQAKLAKQSGKSSAPVSGAPVPVDDDQSASPLPDADAAKSSAGDANSDDDWLDELLNEDDNEDDNTTTVSTSAPPGQSAKPTQAGTDKEDFFEF
jgi:hypothetical protein